MKYCGNSKKNKLKSEDPSYQINLQYSKYTIITGFVYSKTNLTFIEANSSPGTSTKHDLEHEMIGISIGIEFENKLPQHLGMKSIFKVTPQIIIPQKSELKYFFLEIKTLGKRSFFIHNQGKDLLSFNKTLYFG